MNTAPTSPARRTRARDQAGYAAILVSLLCATIFIPLAALAVDVGRWYVEVQRVQNAADAAATAGVTYMPSDFDSAKSTAIAVSGRNGYPNSGGSTVTVEPGSKPTQLKVTVSSKIPNSLAGYFGFPFATISRSAVADYNGPAPMGSPCNTFGNEPTAALVPEGNRGPSSSVIVVPPGGATCTSTPQFWGAIAGPDTSKQNGDAYMTRACASSDSACVGGKNDDFDPLGYFYMVRVGSAAVNSNVTVQIYDPAFVQNGDACGDGPKTTTVLRNNMSPFVPNDGLTRYAPGAGTAFCNGDVLNGGNATDIVTSYVLRSPTDTYQPSQAPPMPQCQRQYAGYDANAAKSETLDSTNAKYKADVAKVYRQWVDLCTFIPPAAGDYYLQIRTNVKLGGTPDGEGGYTNNSRVWEQTNDDTTVKGVGNNRWALRVRGPQRAAVSISGWDHMGVYANYSGSKQTFNLVRVVPAAATKTLNIGFFDVGDASNAGTITIQGPSDSNLPANLSSCTGGGAVVTGALSNCRLNNVSSGSGYQGKWQYINVPIPSNYTCNVQFAGGCWFRVTFDWTGSAPNDTTTWTARIDGDPIRLIE